MAWNDNTAQYNKRERIGRMRHHVKFLKPLVSRGTAGQEKRTWITSGDVWAHIEYRLTGSYEQEVSSRLQDFQAAIVTMRYAATVYPKMRMIADSREWSITAVMPDVKREFMTFEAVIDSPRQQTWIEPSGQDWVDENGDPWVYATAGDVRTDAAVETTWTDSAGISYSGPSDVAYQNEDGSLWATHEAGDVRTDATGLDQWTDDHGITWNPV